MTSLQIALAIVGGIALVALVWWAASRPDTRTDEEKQWDQQW